MFVALRWDRAAGSRGAIAHATPWQERPIIAYPLLAFLALLLVIPAASNGPLLHDSFAISWVWADQFTALLADGKLYPRWLPLSNGGLGAPVFYYYPPLAFFLSGVFGLLGLATYESIIAAFAAAFALSGISCWHWLRQQSPNPMLGAAIYTAAPYHLFDYSVRGALAESLAIAILPLLAIGLKRVGSGTGGKVVLPVAYAALICTHLPLALLASVFLIAPYALYRRERIAAFACSVAAGIALSAIYLVPALVLEPYRDAAQLYRLPSLNTAYWRIDAQHWSDGVFTTIYLILAATIIAASGPAWRRDKWGLYAIAIALVAAGVVPFLWSIPLLEKVQFPYRILPLAELALATAIARQKRLGLPAALPLALPLVLSVLIAPGFGIHGSDMGRLRTLHPDVREYLPRGVVEPGQDTSLAEILGSRRPVPKVENMVVEPVFYFPAWSCGAPEPGTKLLMHEPGCRPQLQWTAAEKLGAAITALAATLLSLGALRNRRRRTRPSPAAVVTIQAAA